MTCSQQPYNLPSFPDTFQHPVPNPTNASWFVCTGTVESLIHLLLLSSSALLLSSLKLSGSGSCTSVSLQKSMSLNELKSMSLNELCTKVCEP